MKRKHLFLASLLAVSGLIVGLIGTVMKYAVLEPLGINRQEAAVAIPFVFLRDAGLRYVVEDIRQPQPTQPPTTIPVPTEPSETVPQHPKPERMLFIGDSRMCGLRDHARAENVDYFCEVGMDVFNAPQKTLSDGDFDDMKLYELLSEREYGCVVIGLGLNEAGYPINSMVNAYGDLLERVVQTQPQAQIYLHGVMAVSRGWAQMVPYTAPDNLQAVNAQIQKLARQYRVAYLDADAQFTDETGYLHEYMTADGCHLYPKYLRIWGTWLLEEVNKGA